MYDNGYEFFHDLISGYGYNKALEIANAYLDMQIKNTNKEEFTFCCELYQATKQIAKPN